ncbi:MAG: phage baseplate assembly protein V, partial [Anaerolineaceae bacterium]
GKKILVDQPVVSQAEADVLAAARLDEISGAFVDAEGTATRRPDIRAGKKVKLENLGSRFSGEYLVTSAVHRYTPEGLTTDFRVSGSRLGLISEMGSPVSVKPVWNGVVIAQVTNTDDPEDRGRVKLKYPWLNENVESDWAKVVGIGAGPNCGLYVIPAVNDEVLVAFEHGDIHRPYVLGGLWSQNAAILGSASTAAGEEPKVRVMQSIDGHIIALYDNGEKKIEILTKDGRKITLSDADRKIILQNSNVTLTLEDSNLKLEAISEMTLEARQIKLTAATGIEINGGAKVDIKGGLINLN